MESKITSLEDLPTTSGEDNNIKMNVSPKNVKIDSVVNNAMEQREDINVPQQPPHISGDDMSKFTNSLQQAASTGTLQLQSRDIPQQQTHLTQDNQAQPNFIPAAPQHDYISNVGLENDIIHHHTNINQVKESKVDDIYNNIQTPLLLAVLYFVWQLPIVKKTTLRLVPSLFRKDGHLNLSGYIANSVGFAFTFYVITIVLEHFSI